MTFWDSRFPMSYSLLESKRFIDMSSITKRSHWGGELNLLYERIRFYGLNCNKLEIIKFSTFWGSEWIQIFTSSSIKTTQFIGCNTIVDVSGSARDSLDVCIGTYNLENVLKLN